MAGPWDDWIPGVLNRSQVRKLCEQQYIERVDKSYKAIGHSSIDLSLSESAYRMTQGSVKPSASTSYESILRDSELTEEHPANGDDTFTLKAKETYVFKLRERLSRLVDSQIYGHATAKSSIGRVDVLVRLIVDGMDTYESFEPKRLAGFSGDMYVEVTPITFDVKVKPGNFLTQLRLFYGKPDNVEIKNSDELYQTVLTGPGAKYGTLSVDLENESYGGYQVAAFLAKNRAGSEDAIPLWVEDGKKSDPCKYWRFKESNGRRLKIEKEQFYLLKSKEKIAVPPGIAIYCRASDETIGEMRIHYAGFVHPLFGLRRDQGRGTPLIFEVRGHQVDVTLADKEKMANLRFFRMSEDCNDEEELPGGTKVKVPPSPYENQTLKLSDFFEKWPANLKVDKDGNVEAA